MKTDSIPVGSGISHQAPGPYSEQVTGVETPRKVYTKTSGSTFLLNGHYG